MHGTKMAPAVGSAIPARPSPEAVDRRPDRRAVPKGRRRSSGAGRRRRDRLTLAGQRTPRRPDRTRRRRLVASAAPADGGLRTVRRARGRKSGAGMLRRARPRRLQLLGLQAIPRPRRGHADASSRVRHHHRRRAILPPTGLVPAPRDPQRPAREAAAAAPVPTTQIPRRFTESRRSGAGSTRGRHRVTGPRSDDRRGIRAPAAGRVLCGQSQGPGNPPAERPARRPRPSRLGRSSAR